MNSYVETKIEKDERKMTFWILRINTVFYNEFHLLSSDFRSWQNAVWSINSIALLKKEREEQHHGLESSFGLPHRDYSGATSLEANADEDEDDKDSQPVLKHWFLQHLTRMPRPHATNIAVVSSSASIANNITAIRFFDGEESHDVALTVMVRGDGECEEWLWEWGWWGYQWGVNWVCVVGNILWLLISSFFGS